MFLINLGATDNRPLYVPGVAMGRNYRGLPDTHTRLITAERVYSDLPPESKPAEKVSYIDGKNHESYSTSMAASFCTHLEMSIFFVLDKHFLFDPAVNSICLHPSGCQNVFPPMKNQYKTIHSRP